MRMSRRRAMFGHGEPAIERVGLGERLRRMFRHRRGRS